MTMTALPRYTRPVDGTIPVSALLYDDESLLASQDGVGLYDGPNKSAPHQFGSIHITSHRLFFIAGAPSSSPNYAPPPTSERGASLALDLGAITHTESYTGFFTSSPKVTLHLRAPEQDGELETSKNFPESASTLSVNNTPMHTNNISSGGPSSNKAAGPALAAAPFDNPFDLWECEICGHRNPPGLSPAARSACGLCGMPRTVSSSSTPSTSTPRPTSSLSTNVTSPNLLPMPILSSRSTLSPGPAYLHSRSLPSSSAATPAPLSMSPPTQADAFISRESEGGLEEQNKRRKRRPSTLACPACTFLNHPSLQECEICGTSLLSTAQEQGQAHNLSQIPNLQPPHLASKSAPTSRPVSPVFDQNLAYNFKSSAADIDERERYIKLSFRKGGDKAFYAALKTALQQKEWEVRDVQRKTGGSSPDVSSGTSGISGILQTINSTAQHTERGMSDAFADLEALMSKAQDMVRLAKGLNEQLAAAARSPSEDAEPLEPEEATFVRSSLGQLGLGMRNTAVTADMSNDERKYLEQLAIELAGVLESDMEANVNDRSVEKVGIMRKRGIVGLDEVWGGWNRARGVALVSPETTLKVLPYLPLHTMPPITTRTLASGLRVLHTPAYAPSAFAARLVALLTDTGACTTTAIASSEMLSVGLVDELVGEVEERGDICRDDPQAGINGGAGMGIEVRWWVNAFNSYVWDGQNG